MKRKQIEVTIDKDGNITVDAIGYEGKACEQATKAILDALVVNDVKKKPEYDAKRQQSLGNG